MKLLIVTPIFPPRTGGPATYVWELAKRLHKKHQVTILCFSPRPKQLKGVQVIAIPEEGTGIARQWRLFTQTIRLSKQTEGVYIQGGLVVGLVATLAVRLTGKQPVIKFVGDEVWEGAQLRGETGANLEDFFTQPLSWRSWVEKNLQKISFCLARKIIVPADSLKRFVVRTYQISPGKIDTIYNAVEIAAVSVKRRRHQLVSVGRLVPWKQIDQVMRAVAQARQRHPYHLLVVGEGSEAGRLKRLAKDLRADKWIQFTGRLPVEKTRKLIAQAEKLILYSSYEGQPHVLIEALLMKTPVIVSNIPANKEALKDYGRFVPLQNQAALVRAIQEPVRVKVEAAKRFAQGRYRWQANVSQLEKILWKK